MSRKKLLLLVLIVELLLIAAIALANVVGRPAFYLFYNIGYGVLLSVLVPLWHMYRQGEGLGSSGMGHVGARQILVMLAFAVFSIGGQAIPLVMNHTQLDWALLPMCLLPLVMTTFFEEFLFRGFFQVRLEKAFGLVPALLISGAMFSLYHVGYPGFRNIQDLLLLFAVGTGFGLAFKLGGNSLFTAYFVNLPNALLTYMLKSNQFPVFDGHTSIYAACTIVLIIAVFAIGRKNGKVSLT